MPVTINCDMGEAFGIYKMGDDEACMPYITHANVACGFHASDPKVMWRTVRLAKKHGIAIGAHPGLPDREGFGRREMKLSRDDVAALVTYQVGALKGFLDAEGVPLSHIKPHGALFGMAMKDEAVAHGIADVAEVFGVPLIGFAGCVQEEVYKERRRAVHLRILCRPRLRRQRLADHHHRAQGGRSRGSGGKGSARGHRGQDHLDQR